MIQESRLMPELTLRANGEDRSLGDPRRSPVVFVLHDPECEDCRAYLRDLGDAAREISAWDGAVRPVVHGTRAAAQRVARATGAPWPVLLDPGDDVRLRCGVPRGHAAVLVADRWNQIWLAAEAPCALDLPGEDEVERILRFIGLQCPECNTEDSPRPSW